ncbi:MAG: PHP domain-containing protein [Spirochaetota bacterium]|nr:MAG: PHP domain-containing protein [Spirochaetota bacterium]
MTKYKIIADLHVHTVASGHAADTIRVVCKAAEQKKLDGIAITDHGPGVPGGAERVYFWTLPRLARGIKTHTGLRVITGIEEDIKNRKGELMIPAVFLKDLEIIMAGCHPLTWIAEQSAATRTDALINAIVKNHIQVVTHPFGSGYDLNLEAVIDACVASGVALEFNASKVNDMNESLNFLERCAQKGASITVGSDAHVAEEVGDFNRILPLLQKTEFPEELIINRSKEAMESFFKLEW